MSEQRDDVQQIGPYRIIRIIGEGGKGRVYEAEQVSPVRRSVALKILRSSASDPSDAIRFSAEQQALAMMDHNGIAAVYDAGTEEDGRQWFAMELVDGMPLVEFADHYELSTDARIKLFAKICRAVHHAHQKGVIHRDLKPNNVIVTMEDGTPSPRVIDFGVAKAVGLRLTEETLLTQFGAIIGTPAYMSPEQSEGTDFSVDTRADIYSLGVMLYELLVGCLPVDPRVTGYPQFIAFLKEDSTDAPTPAARFRQLPEEQQADLAATRKLARSQLLSTLASDLRWIIMTALDKDPARRYQSAAAMAGDLDRYVSGDTVSARPPSTAYQLRKFVSRNRAVVAAAAIVVLALAGGTVAATLGMLRAEREATVANTVSEFLENIFAEASPFARSGEEVTVTQLLQSAAENVETDLADSPEVQGRLMLRIGSAYRDIGQFEAATPILERALVLLRQSSAPTVLLADAEHQLGYHLVFMSEFDRARELLHSSVDKYRQELGYGDPQTASAIGNLAFNELRSSGDIAGAYEMLDRDIPRFADALGPEAEVVSFLMYTRCWTLRSLGRNVDALNACLESLALIQKIHDKDFPVEGHNTLAVGHALRALGRYEESLEYYRRNSEIGERLYGSPHPEIAYGLAAMATSYRALGELDLSLERAQEAAAMMIAVHGSNSTEYGAVLATQADTLTTMERYDEARELYRTIIRIDSASIGPASARVAQRKVPYVDMLLRQGSLQEAEQVLAGAMEVLLPASATDPGVIGLLHTAGKAAYLSGRIDDAEAYWRDAHARANLSPEDYPVQRATSAELLSCLDANPGATCPL